MQSCAKPLPDNVSFSLTQQESHNLGNHHEAIAQASWALPPGGVPWIDPPLCPAPRGARRCVLRLPLMQKAPRAGHSFQAPLSRNQLSGTAPPAFSAATATPSHAYPALGLHAWYREGHGAPERSAFALSARNALVSRARLGWFEAAHEAALSRVFDRARRAQRPNRPPPPATPCQPACRWPYARMLASPKASSQQRALAARVPRCRPT